MKKIFKAFADLPRPTPENFEMLREDCAKYEARIKAAKPADQIRTKRPKKDGFSLVELMVCLAIIGILSAVAMPSVFVRIENERARATVANAATLNNAVHDWMITQQLQEVTFGASVSGTAESKWIQVERLICGGFESCEVVGYTFSPDALNACYMSIVQFVGVPTSDLYTIY